jgi:hypothetical protein
MSFDRKDDSEQVVDLSQVRAQKIDEKRRTTERLFFKQILGIYTVTGNAKLRAIEIVDVSENGLSFQLPFDAQDPWPTEDKGIPIRLYFSQETYLPIYVNIQNSRPSIEHGIRYIRYGCQLDQESSTFETYRSFIKFMKLYSENAHKDKGEVTFFY